MKTNFLWSMGLLIFISCGKENTSSSNNQTNTSNTAATCCANINAYVGWAAAAPSTLCWSSTGSCPNSDYSAVAQYLCSDAEASSCS